jgi:phage virion morphogenesis protein
MFTVELKAEAVTAALTRASEQLGDMTPLFTDIGEILVDSTKQRFGKGEAPDGSKWKPKSQTTLNAYGARKSNRVDVRPLFGPSGILSAQIFSEPAADQVEIGSNRVYAAMMHHGGTKAAFPHLWGDIPARPFLGVSAEDEVNITAQIADYLSGALQP